MFSPSQRSLVAVATAVLLAGAVGAAAAHEDHHGRASAKLSEHVPGERLSTSPARTAVPAPSSARGSIC